MTPIWIDSIPSVEGGRIKLEKNDLGERLGAPVSTRPKTGIMHTMEVGHIDISWGGFPHVAVGKHRDGTRPVIQQTNPLNHIATALRNGPQTIETNRWAHFQIELADFSELEEWLPDDETCVLLASLFEFAQKELGIPEFRPFPDKLEQGEVWASNNDRRMMSKWGRTAGWFGHVEVPDQDPTWHWDPGSFLYTPLLRRETVTLVPAYSYVISYDHLHKGGDVHRHNVRVSPFFEERRDLRRWMLREGNFVKVSWMAARGYIPIKRPDRTTDWRKVRRPRPHITRRRVRESRVR